MAIKSDREGISARLRYDILRRCNFACYYCSTVASLGLKRLQIDHVIPVALGGTNDPWNLVAACSDCNFGKGPTPPDDDFIRRVRGDYCAYLQAGDGEVYPCEYCGLPVIVLEDEEFYGDCSACNELKCNSYEVGRRTVYEEMGVTPCRG